jgi:hypothetical protein
VLSLPNAHQLRTSSVHVSTRLWHRRLGHVGWHTLAHMAKACFMGAS